MCRCCRTSGSSWMSGATSRRISSTFRTATDAPADAPGGLAPHEALDVAGDDVGFDVDRFADLTETQRGDGLRVGDDRDGERTIVHSGDGQADAVNGDGAFVHDIPEDLS